MLTLINQTAPSDNPPVRQNILSFGLVTAILSLPQIQVRQLSVTDEVLVDNLACAGNRLTDHLDMTIVVGSLVWDVTLNHHKTHKQTN